MKRKLIHKFIDGAKCKLCGKCNEFKPLNEYYKNVKNWDKLDNNCKDCRKKKEAIYRENHPDYMREYVSKNIKLSGGTKLIYGIYSKHFNCVIYIGETTNILKQRLAVHIAHSKCANMSISKHIREFGEDDIEMFEVCRVHPGKSSLTEHEVAVMYNTYSFCNDKLCNGAPEDFKLI